MLLDGRPDDYVGADAEDETEEATEEVTQATTEGSDVPKTGDEFGTVALMLMLVAIVAFVVSKKVVVD